MTENEILTYREMQSFLCNNPRNIIKDIFTISIDALLSQIHKMIKKSSKLTKSWLSSYFPRDKSSLVRSIVAPSASFNSRDKKSPVIKRERNGFSVGCTEKA